MFTVIYNPVAGKARSKRLLPKLLAELVRRKIDYRVLETAFPPDKQYYSDVPCGPEDTVCIVGGDGTVLEVLNHLPALGFHLISVPCGTGNDFLKCVKLPKDPVKALRQQLDGQTRPLDYATASGELFLNVFGVGFDVDVLKKLYQFKKKHTGIKAYLLALVKAVKEYQPTHCKISVDGSTFRDCTCSILSVGNGQFIGGGMKAVPSGDPFDGLLNVVEVRPVKKWQLLILLPSFIFGFHIKLGLARTYSCKSVTLLQTDLGYEIDGEVRSADRIDIRVQSGPLRFCR